MVGRIIADARAEALFVTDLQRSDFPTPEEVRLAIKFAIRRHGGSRNCAALVAHEFGEHPETAVARMRWARQAVELAFPAPEPLGAVRQRTRALTAVRQPVGAGAA